MFPAGLLGYLTAVTLVEPIRSRLGRRGIAVIAPILRISAALVVATRPTFAILLAVNAVYGMGSGLTDISWNNWASCLSQPNLAQGLLHGSFSVGCILGPAIAVALLKIYPWNAFYLFLVS
jgi:MFS family permease